MPGGPGSTLKVFYTGGSGGDVPSSTSNPRLKGIVNVSFLKVTGREDCIYMASEDFSSFPVNVFFVFYYSLTYRPLRGLFTPGGCTRRAVQGPEPAETGENQIHRS